MKQALVKHYLKILVTILVLGAGSYFHVDVSKGLEFVGKYFAETSTSAPPDAGVPASSDAGK